MADMQAMQKPQKGEEARRSLAGFAAPRIAAEAQPDGSTILRSLEPLQPYARSITERLAYWAAREPSRPFIAERSGAGWRRLSYGEALQMIEAIAASLLSRDLGPERPIMIVADAGVDHALLALAAMHVGIPVSPISPAYARLSQDFGKLRFVFEALTPGLIYVQNAAAMEKPLTALDAKGIEVISSAASPGATEFDDLLKGRPGGQVAAAHGNVGPDTVAKILFTSGSTGMPKGVINTQRMLCSNQQAILQIWPFIGERPPVLLDWLPWSHTFGGNHNFNIAVYNGGAFYIDDGRPLPAMIGRTVENLRLVQPTVYFNVPRGYGLLLDELERDRDVAHRFFKNLDFIFYAAAPLPQSLWTRIEALCKAAGAPDLPMISSWGTTETAPMSTSVHYRIERAGNIGVPVPGVEIKLAPVDGKAEIRVRGPNVTPGYWRSPESAAKGFDADGWYRSGDAVVYAEPGRPERGLVFDGRIGENFKLTSGTWVNVGTLRTAVVAAMTPLVDDAVVTGHGRDTVGLLLFANIGNCRKLCPDLGDGAPEAVLAAPAVREAVRAALMRHNELEPASSTRIARALLMAEPPTIDAHEITDKGYINQRAVLDRRRALVDMLYLERPPEGVLVIA